MQRGKFGRILGELWRTTEYGDQSINQYLVDKHHAVRYYGQSKSEMVSRTFTQQNFGQTLIVSTFISSKFFQTIIVILNKLQRRVYEPLLGGVSCHTYVILLFFTFISCGQSRWVFPFQYAVTPLSVLHDKHTVHM